MAEMKDAKPGGPLDLPGVETRTAGLRGQTRLLIMGALIVVLVVIGMLHPGDKALQPSQAALRPGGSGNLIYSNAKLTFPVPSGWVLASGQKADEVHLQNADNSCRVLVMRTGMTATPESFQQGMAKKMADDGHRITVQSALMLSGRHAAQMRADLKSGSAEEVYTVQAGSSMYTLVLVQMPACKEDLAPTAQGFRIAT